MATISAHTSTNTCPKFSIIIPLFNKESYLSHTIKSILSQTYTDFEIIIIDDGSTDASKAIVSKFNDYRLYYYYQKNQGVSAARNHGIAKATGTYIAFLDADDYWFPFFLDEIYKMILDYPSESIFAMAIERVFKKCIYPAAYSIHQKTSSKLDYFEGSRDMSLLTTSSSVIHASVFDRIGNFNTTLFATEDIDLWIRIGIHYPIIFNPKIGVQYIDTPYSLSNLKISLHHKSKYDSFENEAKDRPYLQRFLDQNRFALAIESKLLKDKLSFSFYKRQIMFSNLNWKQKTLLLCPSRILSLLFHLKSFLKERHLNLTVFK